MATTNLTLWLLSAIIPLVMATYMFGHDNNGDIVRDLVQQVRDLQVTVNQQGKRIEDLEHRLAQKETFEKTEKPENNKEDQTDDHPALDDEDHTSNSSGGSVSAGKTNTLDDRTSKHNGKLNRGIRSGETVAFSVYLDKRLSNLGVGRTVKFTNALYNNGNHYNMHTGVFTAPMTGIYMFIYFIDDDVQGNIAAVRLMVDDVHEVDAVARGVTVSSEDEVAGNSAILLVNAGQAVWLEVTYQADAALYGSDDLRTTTFSGFLIN